MRPAASFIPSLVRGGLSFSFFQYGMGQRRSLHKETFYNAQCGPKERGAGEGGGRRGHRPCCRVRDRPIDPAQDTDIPLSVFSEIYAAYIFFRLNSSGERARYSPPSLLLERPKTYLHRFPQSNPIFLAFFVRSVGPSGVGCCGALLSPRLFVTVAFCVVSLPMLWRCWRAAVVLSRCTKYLHLLFDTPLQSGVPVLVQLQGGRPAKEGQPAFRWRAEPTQPGSHA